VTLDLTSDELRYLDDLRGDALPISRAVARATWQPSGWLPDDGVLLALIQKRVYTRSVQKDEAQCACAALRRATRAVTAAYDAALAPSGLRVTQFSVLRTLARLGPVPVTRLAAEAALDRSTMGRNLDPLERRGLVRIEAGHQDQRERVVHLTAAGQAAVELALPCWRAAQARVAALVQPATIGALADQLSSLRPT
jgi:DNA-binding MarR family transcriptional regulator